MKNLIKKCIPSPVLALRRIILKRISDRRLAAASVEKVFTDIYANNVWGGVKGEFCSGDGSRDEQIISAYIQMVAEKTKAHNLQSSEFVDLGCGDFRVGELLLPLCKKYLGVDVVRTLIDSLTSEYGNEKVAFEVLNIVEDALPAGDVCFIRQVLQHLSNKEIKAILQKLNKYKLVFITEHYPCDNPAIVVNIDKVHGGCVRVSNNSGVYLTEPPFSLPEEKLELVLELKGTSLGKNPPRGLIRTYLYQPQLQGL